MSRSDLLRVPGPPQRATPNYPATLRYAHLTDPRAQ